jgi:RimJ/RimL family protein N-acetyltransferase
MITVTELERGNTALVEATFSYLMRHEATHCLQIGLFIPFIQAGSESTRWWIAQVDGVVVGIASRTLPHNVVLSTIANETAILSLVNALGDVYPELPGVLAPEPWSAQFAELWASTKGIEHYREMREAIYACSEVIFPENVEGSARFGNENDVSWMSPWVDQFFVDAGMPPEGSGSEDFVRSRLAKGGWVVWLNDAGEPVSIAGFANPTPNGIRVGPVYTPERQRGHGYGVAVSAAVTQHLLDSGRSFVFLFADLDYPVSNHVYKKIGYQPVAEFGVYRFASES